MERENTGEENLSTIEFVESATVKYEICLLERRVLCWILKKEATENKFHLPLCLSICLTAFISHTLWHSLWPHPYPCLPLILFLPLSPFSFILSLHFFSLFLSLFISLSLHIYLFLSLWIYYWMTINWLCAHIIFWTDM